MMELRPREQRRRMEWRRAGARRLANSFATFSGIFNKTVTISAQGDPGDVPGGGGGGVQGEEGGEEGRT